MADFWVSTEKFWCKFCHSHISVNDKAHHESGNRHRRNVDIFIKEENKQKKNAEREKKEVDKELSRIEREAKKSMNSSSSSSTNRTLLPQKTNNDKNFNNQQQPKQNFGTKLPITKTNTAPTIQHPQQQGNLAQTQNPYAQNPYNYPQQAYQYPMYPQYGAPQAFNQQQQQMLQPPFFPGMIPNTNIPMPAPVIPQSFSIPPPPPPPIQQQMIPPPPEEDEQEEEKEKEEKKDDNTTADQYNDPNFFFYEENAEKVENERENSKKKSEEELDKALEIIEKAKNEEKEQTAAITKIEEQIKHKSVLEKERTKGSNFDEDTGIGKWQFVDDDAETKKKEEEEALKDWDEKQKHKKVFHDEDEEEEHDAGFSKLENAGSALSNSFSGLNQEIAPKAEEKKQVEDIKDKIQDNSATQNEKKRKMSPICFSLVAPKKKKPRL